MGGGVYIGVLVSASLDEQFMSEAEECTPSEAEECTPSEAEGWWHIHWSSRLGFARRTVHERCRRLYPEQSRGVVVYTLEFLVSASLDEQFMSDVEVGGGVCVPIVVLVSASLDEQFMSDPDEYYFNISSTATRICLSIPFA